MTNGLILERVDVSVQAASFEILRALKVFGLLEKLLPK